ncbi:hypothetical protein T484DRAFT_3486633 [Baffinella frigidus]|nr:hypothetical protein T484DRAFT_3486633 [Cryptophyta sp. CCMP2293]
MPTRLPCHLPPIALPLLHSTTLQQEGKLAPKPDARKQADRVPRIPTRRHRGVPRIALPLQRTSPRRRRRRRRGPGWRAALPHPGVALAPGADAGTASTKTRARVGPSSRLPLEASISYQEQMQVLSGRANFSSGPPSGQQPFANGNGPTSGNETFANGPASGQQNFQNRPASGQHHFQNRPASGHQNGFAQVPAKP